MKEFSVAIVTPILFLFAFSGCCGVDCLSGNRELESQAYVKHGGRLYCERCCDIWQSQYPQVGQERQKNRPKILDIEKVTSSDTDILDVWDVKIHYNCPIHGAAYYKEQYHYKYGSWDRVK